MKFNRFVRAEGKSWAYWQFNDYETQINHMYWTGVAAVGYATYQVRNATAPVHVPTVLSATGADANRFPADQKKYVKQAKEFLKWNRCSFIVAATGSLETYFQRIVLTALNSDPALIYKKSKVIDGVSWLKIGIKVDHSKILESVTSGTWPQRYGAIKKLFGAIPGIQIHVAELDKIRIFRNNVGHAFGRTLTTNPNLSTRQAEMLRSITEAKFKDWLSVISKTAAALDTYLVANHIGDFEPMLHLHNYIANQPTQPVFNKAFANKYKVALAKEEGHSKGLQYCEELIAAYQKA